MTSVDSVKGAAAVQVGLISDTHLPQRMTRLPESLPRLFEGVQLILHAGDVGELWVLDELGALAPVVAVHGNDDSAECQRELPERVVLNIAGQRVLLWHGHHARRADETEFRRMDGWKPKLDRLVAHARAAGASVVVSGHTHVPLVTQQQGVWLVNPGALASGNAFSVQTRRSVARMTLAPHAAPQVQHFDVTLPGTAPLDVTLDLTAGFAEAARACERTIFKPERLGLALGLLDAMNDHRSVLEPGYLRVARRVWAGDLEHVTWPDLHREWRADQYVSASVLEQISPAAQAEPPAPAATVPESGS